MLKTKKKEVTTKVERVNQSQLGMFINLIHKDTPAENIRDMKHLAKLISESFNVDCKSSDVEKFYELDNWQENYENESKIIEYGI